MKNIIIVIIVALLVWGTISLFKPEKKPDNAVVKYAEGLKSSEEKAEQAKDTANMAIIQSAISRFRGSQGRYPDSLQELVDKGFIQNVPQGISYDRETGEAK